MITKKLKILIFSLSIILTIIVIIAIILIDFNNKTSIITKGKLIENYREENCAFLVIDIQEVTTGKFATNEYYIANSKKLISNINHFAESFKENGMVIYIKSEISHPIINLLNNSYAQGSENVKFDNRLKIVSNNIVVKSANDAFYQSKLDSLLIRNKISKLYITGLDIAYCINNTIKAAIQRGYKISIIDEAVISESQVMKDSLLSEFRNLGVKLIHIDEIDF